MGANIAGIYGAQIYRSDDRPRYRRAFTLCIALLAVATLCAIVRKVDEVFARRKNTNVVANDSSSESEAYENLKAEPQSNVQDVSAPPMSAVGKKTKETGSVEPNTS